MAIKKIVIATPVIHEASLLRMASGRIIRDLSRRIAPLARDTGHSHLVQIAPEAAEIQLVAAATQLNQVRIDGVIRLAAVTGDTDAPVVCPRADIHGGRCSDADARGLGTEGRDSVVEVVGWPYLVHFLGPRGLDSLRD